MYGRSLKGHSGSSSPSVFSLREFIDLGALYDARNMVLERFDRKYELDSDIKEDIEKGYKKAVEYWITVAAGPILRGLVALYFRDKWPSPYTLWTMNQTLACEYIKYLITKIPDIVHTSEPKLTAETFLLMCLTRHPLPPVRILDSDAIIDILPTYFNKRSTRPLHIPLDWSERRRMRQGKNIFGFDPDPSRDAEFFMLRYFMNEKEVLLERGDYIKINSLLVINKYEAEHLYDHEEREPVRKSAFIIPEVAPDEAEDKTQYTPLILYRYELYPI